MVPPWRRHVSALSVGHTAPSPSSATARCHPPGRIIAGAVALGELDASDAATDFRQVPEPCTVVSNTFIRRDACVDHSNQGSECSGWHCYDDWVYSFCLAKDLESAEVAGSSTCSPIYKSAIPLTNDKPRWEKLVCEEKCDKCKSRTTTPMFAVGRLKRCWEPLPGFIPEYPYSCGNKPCYRTRSSTLRTMWKLPSGILPI